MSKPSKSNLTAKELRDRLDYSIVSGKFYWKSFPRVAHKFRGKQAGCVEPTGYRIIKVRRVRYLAHRLAWLYITGKWPKDQIDHINGIRDCNAFHNLRECDAWLNIMTRKYLKWEM